MENDLGRHLKGGSPEAEGSNHACMRARVQLLGSAVGISYNNLAMLAEAQGRAHEAEKLYLKSLAVGTYWARVC